MKKIRLTEGALRRIVKESVNQIINEIGDTEKGLDALGQVRGRADKRSKQLGGAVGNKYRKISRDAQEKAYSQGKKHGFDIYDPNGAYDKGVSKGYEKALTKESHLHKIVKESVDEFSYGDSDDLGKGRHRQTIIYNGKEIGYLLAIEKNWLAPIEEKYILPDIEYGMQPSNGGGLLDGKKGWIDFKVFTDYDEAFRYASQNFEELAYLFEYGDYD